MPDEFITCPECGAKIPLSQALTHDIEERVRQDLTAEFESRALKERTAIEEKAREKAEEAISLKLKDLQSEVLEKSGLLEQAQQQELAFRKKQRELEEKVKNIELEIARQVDQEKEKIEAVAIEKALESHRLRDREKDKRLADLGEKVNELQRKLEQGSQQTQGEVLELELEDILRQRFPYDDIAPIAKGTRGGDVLQTVHSPSGQACGTILWESKRTKTWNVAWIDKIKDDQREAKADIAVILSTALPKEVSRFDQITDVWVTDFICAMPLAMSLREGLINASKSRLALVGKSHKMEVLYEYLSGPQFKQRVQALTESFITMKKDLDGEKRAIERLWAKREKQIERVITNTAGMYGDLQGIIGASLPELKILELPSTDAAEDDSE